MKKYFYIFLAFFFFTSNFSFALFDKIHLGQLKIEIRKENLNEYCSSCKFPNKEFYENFSHSPNEGWAIVWSDEVVKKKLGELRIKKLLKENDKIIGLIPNENSIKNKGKLYFLVCDEASANTLRKSLNGFDHMPMWDFITPKGNYELYLVQVRFHRYTFILENLKEAQYEWDD